MTPTAEQQAQLKLDELSSGFASWRANKKHRSESIPMALLIQAQALTGVLNTRAVCKQLNLSLESIQRVDADNQAAVPVSVPTFAELPLPLTGRSPSLRVEIHTATGELIVMSNLSTGSVADIVAKLLA